MKSFTIFDVGDFNFDEFPRGERKIFSSNPQQVLGKDMDDIAKTSIEYIGEEFIKESKYNLEYSFKKFEVTHEIKRKINGRYLDKEFDHILEKKNLIFWIDKDKGIAVSSGNSKACREAIKRSSIPLSEKNIDLQKLKDAICNNRAAGIIGAMFRNLSMKNIDSAIIYGHEIDESEEYEKYNSFGSISALLISIEDIEETIRIGKNWNLLLYSNFSNDVEYLKRLLIHKRWIEKLLAV